MRRSSLIFRSLGPGGSTENCQLSSLSASSLLSPDLRNDLDWDVFEKVFGAAGCEAGSVIEKNGERN